MKVFSIGEAVVKGAPVVVSSPELCGVPLGQWFARAVSNLEVSDPDGQVAVHFLDVGVPANPEMPMKLVKETEPGDRKALFHIYTSHPEGGTIHLRSSIDEEVVENKRVIRRPRVIEDAAGVIVLAERVSPVTGTKEFLVECLPGARFRIVRTGDLEGSPYAFDVGWAGWWKPEAFDVDKRNEIKNWGVFFRAHGGK